MSQTTPLRDDPTAADPAPSSSPPAAAAETVDVRALLARIELLEAQVRAGGAAPSPEPSPPGAVSPARSGQDPPRPLPPFKPWKGIFWLIQRRLSGVASEDAVANALLVGWAIALQTPEDGTFATTWPALAKFVFRGGSTVRVACARLREAGLLTWTGDNHGIVFTWTPAAYEIKGSPGMHQKRHTDAISGSVLGSIDALRDEIYRSYIAWYKASFAPKTDEDKQLAQVAEVAWASFRASGWRGVKSCDEATWDRWTLTVPAVAQALARDEGAPLTAELVREAVLAICNARREACPGLLPKKWPFGMFDAQDVERVIGPLTHSLAKRRPKAPKVADKPAQVQEGERPCGWPRVHHRPCRECLPVRNTFTARPGSADHPAA